jgi:hypothetical protein
MRCVSFVESDMVGETYGSMLGMRPMLQKDRISTWRVVGEVKRTDSKTEERSDGHVLPMMSVIGGSRDSDHCASKQRRKSKPCSSLWSEDGESGVSE